MDRRIKGGMALAAAVVLGLFLLAGCGSSSDASSEVTKAEFIKEANSVCAERRKDWEAQVSALLDEFNATTEVVQLRKSLVVLLDDSLLPMLKTELTKLEELDVPEAGEDTVEKMLQTRARSIETIEKDGIKAVEDPSTFKPFEAEAAAYGMKCSL